MSHKVQTFWPKIIQHQEELRAHPFMPLVGLCGLETEFGLAPLAGKDRNLEGPANIPSIGKLADLTGTDLLEMRRACYARDPMDAVRPWAEKLLRYAEVKFPDVTNLPESLRATAFAANMLAAFFIDYYASTGDSRYLNATLKLLDYLEAGVGRCGTGPGLSRLAAQTLRLRSRLLAESAVRKL